MTLAELDALAHEDAVRELLRCCGSSRWAEAVARSRPFPDRARLDEVASRVWWSLGREDWLEAFACHPRIGERKAPSGAETAWSSQEQAGTRGAAEATMAELARRNAAYEARFGHVYLVCATGKTADEMLALVRARLGNDPDTELRVAAGEQDKITRIRLGKLLGETP